MTDDSNPVVPPEPAPFVPPVVPPASYPPPSGPPPTAVVPQPVYSAFPASTEAKPRSPRRTAILISGISLAVAGVLALLVVAAIGLGNLVTETMESMDPVGGQPLSFGEEEPPLSGEPGATTPAQPEDCPEVCFTVDDLGSTIPSNAQFTAFGTPQEQASWARSQYSSVRSEYTFTARSWADIEGDPATCFPTYFGVPVAVPYDERPGDVMDRVDFTATWTDAGYYTQVSTTTRLFVDAASASAHLAEVNRLIGACSGYESGSGADYWSAEVSLEPALELPPTTAAAGWVEQGNVARYYVFDVQRSNLVVRTAVWSSGTASEEQVRAFVEQLARQLAAIEPVGAAAEPLG